MKKVILLLAVAFTSVFASAQDGLKIGYVDMEYIIQKLPQVKTIKSQLETEQKMLQNKLQRMQLEVEDKYLNYQNMAETMTPEQRQGAEQELQQLQQQLQQEAKKAEENFQKRSADLFAPLEAEVLEKINEVSKEGNFTYVFNARTQMGDAILLYAKNEGDNLSPKVLAKFGITIPEATNK